ncbi:hypothetical protein LXL04_016321 [Taraxacum kok-saghyz]
MSASEIGRMTQVTSSPSLNTAVPMSFKFTGTNFDGPPYMIQDDTSLNKSRKMSRPKDMLEIENRDNQLADSSVCVRAVGGVIDNVRAVCGWWVTKTFTGASGAPVTPSKSLRSDLCLYATEDVNDGALDKCPFIHCPIPEPVRLVSPGSEAAGSEPSINGARKSEYTHKEPL